MSSAEAERIVDSFKSKAKGSIVTDADKPATKSDIYRLVDLISELALKLTDKSL